MIKSIFLLCIFCSTIGFSQTKANWKNTFVYGVQLPEKLDNYAGIYINIKYRGEPLIGTNKKNKSETEFIYNAQESTILGNTKLPFQLQKRTYYWLLDGNTVMEMKTFPNLYKIEVVTTNAKATKKYNLPETFDLFSQKTMNIEVLSKLSENKRKQEFLKHISILGVQEKISKPIAKTIIDTTFIVDAYKIDKIPIGLLPYYNEICATNKHNHHCQVVINNAYFFNNKLWIPLKPKDAEEKTLLKGADIATIINLISIDGKKITCKDGRITGGDCIMKMKNAKKYKVTLEFEQ